MKEQTAVEWLVDEFKALGIYSSTLKEKCEQAKEMEKEQIADKWQEGYDACEFHNDYENLQTKPINNPYK